MALDDSPAQSMNLRELIDRQPILATGIGAGLIVLATLLAYLPVITAGFVLQDDLRAAADQCGNGRVDQPAIEPAGDVLLFVLAPRLPAIQRRDRAGEKYRSALQSAQ